MSYYEDDLGYDEPLFSVDCPPAALTAISSGGAGGPSLGPGRKGTPGRSRTEASTKRLACSADVAINFGLGFIPGYNAAKVAAALTGVTFNPIAAAFGYKNVLTAGPSPVQAAAGATSVYSFYRWSVFDAAGGASALNRLTDLAGRASFVEKSAAAQASLLGKISTLSNLSQVASGASASATRRGARSRARRNPLRTLRDTTSIRQATGRTAISTCFGSAGPLPRRIMRTERAVRPRWPLAVRPAAGLGGFLQHREPADVGHLRVCRHGFLCLRSQYGADTRSLHGVRARRSRTDSLRAPESLSVPYHGTINDDYVIPVQVLQRGYRVAYEPDAIGYEEAREMSGFGRRVRIVAGNFQQTGRNSVLFAPSAPAVPLRPKALRLPFYFCMVNVAVFAGVYHALTGRRRMRWS